MKLQNFVFHTEKHRITFLDLEAKERGWLRYESMVRLYYHITTNLC